jgi:hypothetical protein
MVWGNYRPGIGPTEENTIIKRLIGAIMDRLMGLG